MRKRYRTSKLYPVLVQDQVGIYTSIAGGIIKESLIAPSDTMGIGFAVTGGSLKPLLYGTSLPAEPITVGLSVAGGELRTLLWATSLPTEPVTVALSVAGGSLTVVLKTYSQWPRETVGITPSIVSGTLT